MSHVTIRDARTRSDRFKLSDKPFIFLASQSPRRRDLLEQIGVAFRILKVNVDESRRQNEAPRDYVLRVAGEKAARGWEALAGDERAPVLAADTVVLIDEEILGKPADAEDAADMLRRLSSRTHEVLSAVCLMDGTARARLNRSLVTFRSIGDAERSAYCATGEPLDKAGAYAIQGRAAAFVSRLDGSYSGVMGLPLFETAALLSVIGIHPFVRTDRG